MSTAQKKCLLLELIATRHHLPAAEHVGLSPPPQHCQEWDSSPPGRVRGSLGYLHGIQLRSRGPEGSPTLSGGWTCWSSGESEDVGFLWPETHKNNCMSVTVNTVLLLATIKVTLSTTNGQHSHFWLKEEKKADFLLIRKILNRPTMKSQI